MNRAPDPTKVYSSCACTPESQCEFHKPIVATVTEDTEFTPLQPPMSLKDFKKKMAKLTSNKEKPLLVRTIAYAFGAFAESLLDAGQEVLGTGKPPKKKGR